MPCKGNWFYALLGNDLNCVWMLLLLTTFLPKDPSLVLCLFDVPGPILLAISLPFLGVWVASNLLLYLGGDRASKTFIGRGLLTRILLQSAAAPFLPYIWYLIPQVALPRRGEINTLNQILLVLLYLAFILAYVGTIASTFEVRNRYRALGGTGPCCRRNAVDVEEPQPTQSPLAETDGLPEGHE